MSTRPVVLVLLGLALSTPLTVPGIASAPAAAGHVDLKRAVVETHDIGLQLALSERREWQSFRARHGHWNAVWNEATASPHLAFGEAITLEGPTGDAAQVDRATRRFIAGHPELFGSPNLATVRAQRVGQVWYLSYRQTVHGVPVLFEDWEFRVGANGKLMMFGADAHRIPPDVATRPALAGAAAREAARAGLDFDPATDQVEGESLYLLPYPNHGRIEYRLVYEARVTTFDPPHSWLTLVDASSAEVLWRRDQVYSAIGGHVSGYIHPTLPTDPLEVRSFAHENVTVGGTTVATDANGAYSVPVSAPSNVTTRLSGPFVNVLVDGQPRTSFTATGQPDGSTVDVLWTTTRDQDALVDAAERDVFYHVNFVHDYEKALDPGLTPIDFPLRVTIFTSCGGCAQTNPGPPITMALGASKFSPYPATASMPDVIYHEYGHVTNDALYSSLGASPPFGMLNPALQEGTADILAAFVQNDPVIANGIVGPGTYRRRVDVANHWPEDRDPNEHPTGLIIAGAFWDLRQSLGLDLAARLYHFAKYGLPDDPDDAGVAMAEYFVQTLVADDDDGNLANGTPHFAAINAAFDAHGIGTGYFVNITHTPIADQSGSGPFPVTATITFDAASLGFGRLDVMSPTLHYSINGSPFVSQRMTSMGGPNQFSGTIPTAAATVVRYYLDAMGVEGGLKTDPPGAPAAAHGFLTGTQTTLRLEDMETNPNWYTGQASAGKWQRDNPVGTFYFTGDPLQPEDDHTPGPGTQCFFTDKNAAVEGTSTLITSAFSAAGIANPVIEYFRWFAKVFDEKYQAIWNVDVSNDGGATWVNVESSRYRDASWRRVLVPVAAFVTPSSNMMMRFVAEGGGASTVEAALDDFRLLSLTPGSGAAAQAASQGTQTATAPALVLRLASPNPSRHDALLDYAVPARGRVDLGIFDLDGRRIRGLERNVVDAGQHHATWDGRDGDGHPVSSGVYFARLEFQGRTRSCALVRMR